MQATILDIADKLEQSIRVFLDKNQGGRFPLPVDIADIYDLTIPLMVDTFEDEGWVATFDYDGNSEWLEFNKHRPKLITADFID